MAIGVKVDPKVLVAGTVILVQERRAFVSSEERARGVVGDVERHDVTLFQDDGGAVVVRFRVRDKLPLPEPGEFVAVEATVSEGSFLDNGTTRHFVNLVAVGPAYGALDLIQSRLSNAIAA